MINEVVTIGAEEYIELRATINSLQSENRRLHAVIDSINLALNNGGVRYDSK